MIYLWWIGKYVEVMFDTCLGALFQRKYCKRWDSVVNEIILEGTFVKFHKNHSKTFNYSATVNIHGNEYNLWLANKWYAYGYNYSQLNYQEQYRPSIKTMIKLEKWLEQYQ